ncbi:TPA: motility associated factor glycosyltransferase family protein, partial [Campylobacter upsaliensis]|nr:motility associated factor glycosyltransferase family protein [Campylobacter upsaliensis]
HDFGNKDDKTTFLLASLVHPNAIEYLEKRGRNYILIAKALPFSFFTALKRWGYLSFAASVAHMNLTIAYFLNFKNIVFIGQDFAYNSLGHSHPKDYQNGENFESEVYDEFEVEGYGGTRVKTHFVWHMFQAVLEEQLNTLDKNRAFYNATEGGVRIKGLIEKPFKECCEEFFTTQKDSPTTLEVLKESKQKEFLLKAFYKLQQAQQNCLEFGEFLSENLNKLNERIEPYSDQINLSAFAQNGMQESIDEVMNIREKITQIGLEMVDIIQPLKAQFDLNLGRLVSIVVKDNETNLQKNLFWIKEHLYYFELIAKYVKDEEKELQTAILKLENELKNRGLEKRVEKLKTQFKDKQC